MRKRLGKERKELIWNVMITSVLMTLTTLLASAFSHYSKNSTSVAILYVLAVMLVARFSYGYVPGIVASFIGVICVNYVFTYPYMHLDFGMDGYPVTFMGMLVISGITSTLTTRFKEQSKILGEREKLLMEAEKETMRANLLRAVSHDLRTPLTGIIGFADTYLENSGNMTEEAKHKLVENISEDANWLLNMVENLLSVTRIRVGDAQVTTTPELLEEVVSEAVMRLKKRLPQAKIRVRVPEEVLIVPMDAMLIEQVIINLLENAVYHSGVNESIDLLVQKTCQKVEIHVRDYGQGIAADRIHAIFDGSGIENNASSDSHRGMGIGLTICKTIITAHRGTIQVQNRERGAEFIFTLPLGEERNYDRKTDDFDH